MVFLSANYTPLCYSGKALFRSAASAGWLPPEHSGPKNPALPSLHSLFCCNKTQKRAPDETALFLQASLLDGSQFIMNFMNVNPNPANLALCTKVFSFIRRFFADCAIQSCKFAFFPQSSPIPASRPEVSAPILQFFRFAAILKYHFILSVSIRRHIYHYIMHFRKNIRKSKERIRIYEI